MKYETELWMGSRFTADTCATWVVLSSVFLVRTLYAIKYLFLNKYECTSCKGTFIKDVRQLWAILDKPKYLPMSDVFYTMPITLVPFLLRYLPTPKSDVLYERSLMQTRIFFSGWRPWKNIRICRTTFLQVEKRWVYSMNHHFFWVSSNQKNNEFAEPLFSNLNKIRVWRTTFLPSSKSLLRVQIKFLPKRFFENQQ